MHEYVNLSELIHRGGLYYDVKGSSFQEVYKNLSQLVSLPKELAPEFFYTELCLREEMMSTAVGKGIAIPHPRHPILTEFEEQRIIVCFLEKPLGIETPDLKPVFALFVVLSSNKSTHLNVLSNLAFLFQKQTFVEFLKTQPQEHELLTEIKKHQM